LLILGKFWSAITQQQVELETYSNQKCAGVDSCHSLDFRLEQEPESALRSVQE